MISLKADNRFLTDNAQFSYLANNYVSGTSSFVLVSVNRLAANDYLLFGEFGAEDSEILKIQSITSASKTVVTTANSTYAHPQDTKVTVLRYNQVKFYRDTVSTGASAVLLATQDIDADSLFTVYYDSVYSSGYGFFAFYNATTAVITSFSNSIPYSDFTLYSVKKIFDSFFSLLNNKERSLITDDDAFLWLNDAYSRTTNSLNLVNTSYMAASTTVSTVASTAEYSLPSNFSDIISVSNSDGKSIDKLDMNKVAQYRDGDRLVSSDNRYYLIGGLIGFVPTPSSVTTFTVYYKKKAGTLTSYDDEISFPDNQFYLLVDFMMFRAAVKLGRPKPEGYLSFYKDGRQELLISAHKQDNKLDSFDIGDSSNV